MTCRVPPCRFSGVSVQGCSLSGVGAGPQRSGERGNTWVPSLLPGSSQQDRMPRSKNLCERVHALEMPESVPNQLSAIFPQRCTFWSGASNKSSLEKQMQNKKKRKMLWEEKRFNLIGQKYGAGTVNVKQIERLK